MNLSTSPAASNPAIWSPIHLNPVNTLRISTPYFLAIASASGVDTNDFTATAVCTNGSYKLGSQYLTGKTSYFCYYFQSTERDAYKGAEEKTGSILKAISEPPEK